MTVFAIGCLVAGACSDGPSAPVDSGFPKDTRQISIGFCTASGVTWFAHQNDAGSWTQVPVVNGTVTFLATERLAIAVVRSRPSETTVEVVYSTATTLGLLSCRAPVFGTKDIAGTVAGLNNQFAVLNLGPSFAITPVGSSNFTFTDVPPGTLDLVAVRKATSNGAITGMIIRRDQNLPEGAVIGLDFGAAEAFALEQHTISTTGSAGGSLFFSHDFRTVKGTKAFLSDPSGGPTVMSVPAAKLVSGDLHETSASAETAQAYKVVTAYYRDPVDKVLPFGPDLSAPTVSLGPASSGQATMQASFMSQYPTGASAVYVEDGASSFRMHMVSVLADYFLSPPTTWTMDMPTLTGVTGFQNSWKLNTATSVYSLRMYDGGPSLWIGKQPADGDVLRATIWIPPSP